MRYPFSPYKIDQIFKNQSSYGPHEGVDLNGLGGGNTDCGNLLYPIYRGQIVHQSESTKNYGKLCVLRIVGPWGERYVRYAHCKKFLKKEGDNVNEAEAIVEMGSTGNSTACHLHLDVMRSIPSGNWRYYTKNASTFGRIFEDPIAFIEEWKDYDNENMDWLVQMYIQRGIDIRRPEGEIRGKIQEIFDAWEKNDEKDKQIKTLERKIEGLAAEAAADEERLRQIEQSRERLEKEVDQLKRTVVSRDSEISSLQNQIVKLQKQLDEVNLPPQPKRNWLSRVISAILRRG